LAAGIKVRERGERTKEREVYFHSFEIKKLKKRFFVSSKEGIISKQIRCFVKILNSVKYLKKTVDTKKIKKTEEEEKKERGSSLVHRGEGENQLKLQLNKLTGELII
jgi:hypothetical protein